MISGYIYSRFGMRVGRRRLQSSLRRVSPVFHEQWRNAMVRRANPVPYYSPYHGHKLHIDQNEKLKDFGVTHVCFSDGHSSQIGCVRFLTDIVKMQTIWLLWPLLKHTCVTPNNNKEAISPYVFPAQTRERISSSSKGQIHGKMAPKIIVETN